jgi:uncharacterized protein (TIGR03067 family)
MLLLVPVVALTAQAGGDKDKPFKVEGKLADTDPRDKDTNSPVNEHKFTMKAGNTYVIDMVSTEVDSFLKLYDPKGTKVAEDDDGGGYPNARILYKADQDGTFKIVCTCYGAPKAPLKVFGKYTLTARAATEDDAKKVAGKGKPVEPPAGGYTLEKLVEALTKLGYEPTVHGANKDRCWITVNRGDYQTTVAFSFTSDRKTIWLECPLATVTFPAQAPSKAVRRLLEENERIGPAHFVYDPSDKRFRLYQGIGNHDWTPAKLRKEIEKFDDITRKTEPVWRIDNFLRLETVPDDVARPEFAKLEGTWKLIEGSEGGKVTPPEQLAKANVLVTIKGNKLTVDAPTGKLEWTIFVDPAHQPKAADFIGPQDRVEAGIYKLEGDKLTIHISAVGMERPVNFTTTENDKRSILVLQRQKQ